MKLLKNDKSQADKKTIHKAAANSSDMEGLSFNRAKKNNEIIKYLKNYGRAFVL